MQVGTDVRLSSWNALLTNDLDSHLRTALAHSITSLLSERSDQGKRRSAWRLRLTPSHGDGQSTRFCVWCSVVPNLIIPMIIQTMQLALPGADATDDAPHVSRVDPTEANQSDTVHPPTDLAVGGSSPSRRAISAGQSGFELSGVGVCLPRLTDLLPVHTAGVNSYEEQRYGRQGGCAPRMAVVSYPRRGRRAGRQAPGLTRSGSVS